MVRKAAQRVRREVRMIRAKLTWAFALVLCCAGLMACSDDGNDPGGSGGTGGIGGSGGTGGSDEAVCGNGIEEADEECDDGNPEPGDGCDATCHKEPGTTGAAPVIEQAAFTVEEDYARVMILVSDEDGDIERVLIMMLDADDQAMEYDIYQNGTIHGPILFPHFNDNFACTAGVCFADIAFPPGFLDIPKIALKAHDFERLESETYFAEFGLLPTRALGEACSKWGFDVCPDGAACTGEPPTCQ